MAKGEAFDLPRRVFVMLKNCLDVVACKYFSVVERCFCPLTKFVDKSVHRLKNVACEHADQPSATFSRPCVVHV